MGSKEKKNVLVSYRMLGHFYGFINAGKILIKLDQSKFGLVLL